MRLLAWLSATSAAALTAPLAVASNRTVSPTTFASLEELARLVDISYCVGSTGIQKPFKCLSRCTDFEGFELVTTWNTGPLLSDSCGYIALSHAPFRKRVIVAFRGTYSIANTIADLSATPAEYTPFPFKHENDSVCATATADAADAQEPAPAPAPFLHTQLKRSDKDGNGDEDEDDGVAKCLNCTVHSGFMASWRNTRCVVVPHVEKALKDNAGYELTLVGHSLGGAVAALAGLEFQARGWEPHVTTFGEPRVGNMAFNAFVNQRFNSLDHRPDRRLYRRVTHVNDPVPLLPLEEWGYTMHAGEVYISKLGLPPEAQDLQYCNGNQDPHCIATGASTLDTESKIDDSEDEPKLGALYGLGKRFRLWELFFAHRDYFWRLGLCVPGGDPWHWSRDQYADDTDEYDELR